MTKHATQHKIQIPLAVQFLHSKRNATVISDQS